MGIPLFLIVFTLGVLRVGGGKQELHSDMTFQFISANEKGPSCGGNLCVNFVSCRFLYNEDYAVRPRK